MERIDYLPLGSVVRLEGGIQDLMVISRGINVKQNDKEYFFDYGAVAYPEGLTGDVMAYFNHDGIARIVFYGYDTQESRIMAENINRYIEANPEIERIDPRNWNYDFS